MKKYKNLKYIKKINNMNIILFFLKFYVIYKKKFTYFNLK